MKIKKVIRREMGQRGKFTIGAKPLSDRALEERRDYISLYATSKNQQKQRNNKTKGQQNDGYMNIKERAIDRCP